MNECREWGKRLDDLLHVEIQKTERESVVEVGTRNDITVES